MHDLPTLRPKAARISVDDEASALGRATRPVGRGPLVTQLLAEVRAMIDGRADSKARRALLRRIQSLQFVVDCWDAMPPRSEQVSAMFEVLLGLQDEVVALPQRG